MKIVVVGGITYHGVPPVRKWYCTGCELFNTKTLDRACGYKNPCYDGHDHVCIFKRGNLNPYALEIDHGQS